CYVELHVMSLRQQQQAAFVVPHKLFLAQNEVRKWFSFSHQRKDDKMGTERWKHTHRHTTHSRLHEIFTDTSTKKTSSPSCTMIHVLCRFIHSPYKSVLFIVCVTLTLLRETKITKNQ